MNPGGVGFPFRYVIIAFICVFMVVGIATHDFTSTGYVVKEDRAGPEAPKVLVSEEIAPEVLKIEKHDRITEDEHETSDFGTPDFGTMDADVNVTGCMELNTPNYFYEVNQSIEGNLTDGTCLNITANNVTLDCLGNSIVGNESGTTYGIYTNESNITIRNCTVGNYSYGIYLEHGDYFNLSNNEIYNVSVGIKVDAADNGSLVSNRISDCVGSAIDNGADYNTVFNNTVHDCYGNYIGGYRNNFTQNIVYNCTRGFDTIASNNTFFNNTLYNNTEYGIFIFWNDNDNLLTLNKVYNNSQDIYSCKSRNNTFTNTTIGYGDIEIVASWEGENYTIKQVELSEQAADPDGYTNISHYLNITNNSAGAWIYLNVSYEDSDVPGSIIDDSAIRIWKNSSGTWYNETYVGPTGQAGIDETNKYVYANITNFSSIYAPMAEEIVYIINEPSDGDTVGWTFSINVSTNEDYNCSARVTKDGSFTEMDNTDDTEHTHDYTLGVTNTSAYGSSETLIINCTNQSGSFEDSSIVLDIDLTEPVVSDIKEENLTGSDVWITWTTDENATGVVNYGTSSGSLTSSESDSSLVADHDIHLTGLTDAALYYFKVNSTDEAGNNVIGPLRSFVTKEDITVDTSDTATLTYTNASVVVRLYVNNTVTSGHFYLSKVYDDPTDEFTAEPVGLFYNISASDNIINNLSYCTIEADYEQNDSWFNETSLRLYRYNDSWSLVDGSVNTTNDYVLGNLTSFSYFGIGSKLADGENCTSDSECVSGNCAEVYNSSIEKCVEAGKCAKDNYTDTYDDGDKFCDGDESLECDDGEWDSRTCTYGCDSATGECESNGGNGGGGSGSSSAPTNYTPVTPSTSNAILPFSSARVGSPQTVDIVSDVMDFRGITLSVNSNLPSGPQVEVSQYDEAPTGVSNAPNEAYKYFYFSATNLPYSYIEDAKMSFRVSNEWLDDNSIDKDTVTFYRKGVDWEGLNTTRLSSDGDYNYYEASTTAFSYFAITGSAVEAPQPECTTDSDCASGYECINENCVEIVEEKEEEFTPPAEEPTFAPAEVCGDGFCTGFETADTCPQDCGGFVTQEASEDGVNIFLIIGGIVATIAAGVLIIFFFVIRPMLEREEEASAGPAGIMPGGPPTMPQLKPETVVELPPEKEHDLEGYVRRNLSRGFTPNMIRTTLAKVGWKPEEIQVAFDLATTPPEKEEELIGFAQRMLQKGFTKNQIIQRLLQAGWKRKTAKHVVEMGAIEAGLA